MLTLLEEINWAEGRVVKVKQQTKSISSLPTLSYTHFTQSTLIFYGTFYVTRLVHTHAFFFSRASENKNALL